MHEAESSENVMSIVDCRHPESFSIGSFNLYVCIYTIFLCLCVFNANTVLSSTCACFLICHNQGLRLSCIVGCSFISTQNPSLTLEKHERVIVVLMWMETDFKAQGSFQDEKKS